MSDCVCPTHIYRDKDGYPRAKHQGRLWRLNRLIWTLSYGEIPDGKVVGHTCNNTGCINITHLYLTTSHENSTHAARDGLYRTGSDHPKFKAKPDLVNEVIRLYDEIGRAHV